MENWQESCRVRSQADAMEAVEGAGQAPAAGH